MLRPAGQPSGGTNQQEGKPGAARGLQPKSRPPPTPGLGKEGLRESRRYRL